jgi:hypothetical protein
VTHGRSQIVRVSRPRAASKKPSGKKEGQDESRILCETDVESSKVRWNGVNAKRRAGAEEGYPE